jgi:hypothetical protein
MAVIGRSIPSISADPAYPNVVFLDRDAEPILVQISQDQFELRQGRCLLGVIAFYNGEHAWGWRFFPRQPGKRPSDRLYPNPEATLKGRYVVKDVVTLSGVRHNSITGI